MNFLQQIFGRDGKFYDLLEASALEAKNSAAILARILPQHGTDTFDAFSFLKNSELTLYQVIEWLFHFKCSHTFVNIIVDMYCSVLNSVAITCENAPLSP